MTRLCTVGFLTLFACGGASDPSRPTTPIRDGNIATRARECTDKPDGGACEEVAKYFADERLPGAPDPPDPARAQWFYEVACDLGPYCMRYSRYLLSGGKVPLDVQRGLYLHRITCIERSLDHSACNDLRERLIRDASARTTREDWLPIYGEHAKYRTSELSSMSPDQALAEKLRILAVHEERCRRNDLGGCEELVTLDALRFAASITEDSRNIGAAPRFRAIEEWGRLCTSGVPRACLYAGLYRNDEAWLRRACLLGEALGCTRALGIVVRRGSPSDVRDLRARACTLGRKWAC